MKIGIVGAGIMGRLMAYALYKRGDTVTIFDRDQGESCSDVAAGLLTPVVELEKNDKRIYDLGHEAIQQHWPAILSDIGQPIYYQQKGSLVVSHERDRAELYRLRNIISSKLPDVGAEYLEQTQLLQLEPMLGRFQAAYYFPSEAQIDSQQLMRALTVYLADVTWYRGVDVQALGAGHITANDKTYTFDCVLDCRGMGAKNMFTELRAIRGELIWLHAPAVTISRPVRLLHPRYSLYIVPRPDHVYLVGATEIESDDTSAITVRSLLELLTAVYSIHPGFSDARVIKTVTQNRPTLTHHLPSIKYQDGLIALNGLYRHGYLIAPTLMADVLTWFQQGMTAVRYADLWEQCA